MLALLASAAFAQSLPLPDVHPTPRPLGSERAAAAHWTAEAGRWTALGGVGLASVSLLPVTICVVNGGDLGCSLSLAAMGVGAGGVLTGLTMQGIGSHTYLRKNGQGRRGAVGAYLVLGGAAGIVTGMLAPDVLGPVAILGANAIVGGVVLLDVQHVRTRRGLSVLPTVGVADRSIGVTGRF